MKMRIFVIWSLYNHWFWFHTAPQKQLLLFPSYHKINKHSFMNYNFVAQVWHSIYKWPEQLLPCFFFVYIILPWPWALASDESGLVLPFKEEDIFMYTAPAERTLWGATFMLPGVTFPSDNHSVIKGLQGLRRFFSLCTSVGQPAVKI